MSKKVGNDAPPGSKPPRITVTVPTTFPATCTLCHRPTYVVGEWRPNSLGLAELGLPAAQRRVVLYALCRKHARNPAKSGAKIEEWAIAEYRKKTGFHPRN